MNTAELIADARIMLDAIEQCHSAAFKQAAARQLANIAVQLQSAASLPESGLAYVRKPIRENVAVEPQVKMPEPPAGMKWEYRGMGWKSGRRQGLTYAYAFDDSDEANCFYTDLSDYEETCATRTAHYWEAVPITDEPDRPVIDVTKKYRTRDGREITGLKTTSNDKWCYTGQAGGCSFLWTENGTWSVTGEPHALDLIPTGEIACPPPNAPKPSCAQSTNGRNYHERD